MSDPVERGLGKRNPVERLTGYERNHLVAHLVKGQLHRELHDLLAREWTESSGTPQPDASARRWFRRRLAPAPARARPRNAWHAGREDAGEAGGYAADLDRASAAAAAASAESLGHGVLAPAVGLEVRYGLYRASAGSRSTALGPDLLRALIDSGTWTPAHALAHAEQATTPQARVAALAALLPALPKAERERVAWEALGYATEIRIDRGVISIHPGDRDRSRALALLVPHLNAAQLRRAGELAGNLRDGEYREEVRAELVPALVGVGQRDDALRTLRPLSTRLARNRAMKAIAADLTEAEVRDLLAAAVGNLDDLATLAAQLARLGHLDEALTMVAALSPIGYRAPAIAELAPYVSGRWWTTALTEARQLELPDYRARTLAAFARAASTSLRPQLVAEVLAAVAAIKWDHTAEEVLAEVVDVFAPPDAAAIFGRVSQFDSATSRIRALAALAPLLPAHLDPRAVARTSADDPRLLSGMVPDLWIRDTDRHRSAAASLAALLPDTALDLADRLTGESRSLVVNAMALTLPASRLPDAVDLVARIGDEHARDSARAAFQRAVWLRDPPVLPDILRVDDERLRAELVARAAPGLAPEDVASAAVAATAMHDGDNVATALRPLVVRLPDATLDAVLDRLLRRKHVWAFHRDDRRGFVWLVDLIAPRLSEQRLADALRAAWQRRDGDAWRGWALATLVPHLPAHQFDEMIVMLGRLGTDGAFQRDAALSQLSARLAAVGMVDQAVELLDQIEERKWSDEAASALIGHLPDDAADSWLARPREPAHRAGLLLTLAEHRAEADRARLVDQALAELRGLDRIPAATLSRAGSLAPRDRLPSVLSVATSVTDEQVRADCLARLTPYLTAQLRIDALAAALTLPSPKHRTHALAAMVPLLAPLDAERAVVEAGRTVASVEPDTARRDALVSYATALAGAPAATAHRAWRGLLAQLTVRGRAVLLTDLVVLAEFIETIGGPDAAARVLDSIDEAGRWWP